MGYGGEDAKTMSKIIVASIAVATLILACAGLYIDSRLTGFEPKPEVYDVIRLDHDGKTMVLTLYEDGTGYYFFE